MLAFAVSVFRFILEISPAQTVPGLVFRAHVADAIAASGATEHEGRLLANIALHEGMLRSDVADCRVRGDNGRARGLWQIHARTGEEYREACTLHGGAKVALARVRESIRVCGDLTAYCSGKCGVGVTEARVRWVAP